MNELRHLIFLKEPTIVYLNKACNVIAEQTELQTQRKPNAFSHYLAANKSLIHAFCLFFTQFGYAYILGWSENNFFLKLKKV